MHLFAIRDKHSCIILRCMKMGKRGPKKGEVKRPEMQRVADLDSFILDMAKYKIIKSHKELTAIEIAKKHKISKYGFYWCLLHYKEQIEAKIKEVNLVL